MDFTITDAQRVVQNKAKAFAVTVVKPRLTTMENEDRFPAAVWEAMKESALWGVPYPREYGGGDQGYITYVLALEQISKYSAAVGATLSVHTLAAAAIFHYGTPEQKSKFLPPLLSGEKIGSFSYTEAATGSDPEEISTVAVKTGEGYKLTGRKLFSSNSTLDGFSIIFAKDREKEAQISAFIVPKNIAGLRTEARA